MGVERRGRSTAVQRQRLQNASFEFVDVCFLLAWLWQNSFNPASEVKVGPILCLPSEHQTPYLQMLASCVLGIKKDLKFFLRYKVCLVTAMKERFALLLQLAPSLGCSRLALEGWTLGWGALEGPLCHHTCSSAGFLIFRRFPSTAFPHATESKPA